MGGREVGVGRMQREDLIKEPELLSYMQEEISIYRDLNSFLCCHFNKGGDCRQHSRGFQGREINMTKDREEMDK